MEEELNYSDDYEQVKTVLKPVRHIFLFEDNNYNAPHHIFTLLGRLFLS